MSPKTRKQAAGRRRLSTNALLTLAILALAVVVIGGVLIVNRSESVADNDAGIPAQLEAGPQRNTITETDGDAVTIVEFLDYQCPACAAYYSNVTKRIETDYAGQITFVTRNFPLDAHPLARQAARAAEAAAAQGKYRQMYHELYDNYRQWALTPDGDQVSSDQDRATAQFDRYATTIGLDLARFHQDAASPRVQARIDADLADGDALDVSSTPSIFVNGELFQPEGERFSDVDRQLRGMIDEALDR